MKRIICLILAMLMLIPPMAMPTMAAEEDPAIRVVLDKTDALNVGDTVTATVTATNIQDTGALLLALAYDPAYLSPVTDSLTENISGSVSHNLAGVIEQNESAEMAGKTAVKVAAYSTSGECFSGSGAMIAVSFKILKKASAPGIPLELVANLTNVYDNRENVIGVQLYNAYVNAVEEGKTVTNLVLKAAPTKTKYVQGQALDLSGGVMRVTYSDNSWEDLRLSMAAVTAYNPNQTGDQLAKVTYAGFALTFVVSVEEKVLDSISVSAVPQREYTLGQTLVLTNGIILKNYTNGTCEAIPMTDPAVSVMGFDSSSVGFKTVTVMLGGKSTTFDVTVVPKKISKIEIISNPKTEYVVGQNFDCTGGKVLVTYADSTTEEMPMVPQMVQGFDSSITGKRDIYIWYGAEKTVLSVSVVALRAMSIAVETMPTKTQYVQGQAFNPAGGQLRVYYNDNSSALIPLGSTGVTFTNNLMTDGVFNSYGNYFITVTYKNLTATLQVTVSVKKIESLTVETLPANTAFFRGQPLSIGDGMLRVTYNDGVYEFVPFSDERVVISGYDPQVLGEQTLTITYNSQSYGSMSIPFTVTVAEKEISSIAIIENPLLKKTYVQGQSLNVAFGKLLITFTDSSTQTVDIAKNMVSGFDTTTLGKKTLTVTYETTHEEFTTTYEIEVIARAVKSIVVTPPTKVDYIQGQEINLNGGLITATYNDGSEEKNIPITADMLSAYDKNLIGAQTITVTYGGQPATFNVTYAAKEITGIAVTTKPNKTDYIQGQELDLTGGKITVNYNNGLSEEKDITEEMISGYNKNPETFGEQTITVTYEGFTAEFTVTVNKKAVESITVTEPTDLEYIEGQELNLAGGFITATWNDGEVEEAIPLTDSKVSIIGYNKDVVGTQTITVVYESKSATFEVEVEARVITGITIIAEPTTLDYIQGQEIDPAGGFIVAHYNDTTDGDPIAMTLGMLSGYDKMLAEEQTVTVTYEGFTDTFEVNYEARVITGIAGNGDHLNLYYSDDSQDKETGTITVYYNDGSDEKVELKNATVSDIDFEKEGTQQLTVTYQGFSTQIEIVVIKKIITGITVTVEPTTLDYIQGQEIDPAGGFIVAHYNDTTDSDPIAITLGMLSGYDKMLAEKQTVTVTFGDFTDTFEVTYIAKVITGITVTVEPTKLDYIQGQEIDPAGGFIVAHYNDDTDGDPIAMTLGMLSGYDKMLAEEQTVTVTYEGFTDTFEVNYEAKVITGIAVTTEPTKLEYTYGQEIDLTGGKITVYYNDGDFKEEDITLQMIGNSYDKEVLDEQTITVTYEGFNDTFIVRVNPKAVQSITVTEPSDTEYVVGQELNLAGSSITATYNDESVVPNILLTDPDVSISGYDKDAVGTQTITVTYGGKTATFTVTVIAKVVTQITIKDPDQTPTKWFYVQGEELDLAGGCFNAIYNDGDVVENISMMAEGVTISGYDKDAVGTQTITVTYGGQSATFNVTSVAKEITGIEIDKKPTNLVYIQYQEFNAEGGTIKVIYNYGVFEDIISMEDPSVDIDGYNNNPETFGEQTITVTYEGFPAEFTVTVNKKVVDRLDITPPTKLEYVVGQPLNLNGGSFVAHYNDGEVLPSKPLSEAEISGYNNTVGTHTITVTYGSKSATFEVTVIAKAVDRLDITPPTKVEYIEGQALDLAGGKFVAHYNDGSSSDPMDIIPGMLGAYNMDQIGAQTITLTYEEGVGSFTISVRKKELTKIEMNLLPNQRTYLEGKDTALNTAGGMILLTYDNGTTEKVELSKATLSGFNAQVIGKQTITVSYAGKTTSYEITMNAKSITGIQVTPPTKLEYMQGRDALDLAGGKITVSYDNGTTETLALTASMVSGFDNLFAGTRTVTVTYGGKTATFNVTITPEVVETPFTDVKEGAFYEDAVQWAVNNDVTNGLTETTFGPGNACTRGQIVTFLWRAAGSPEPKTTTNPFTDVKEGKFYYKAVLWAVENGITNGLTATTFGPGNTCTRGQVVTFLWRAKNGGKVSAANPFTDVTKGFYVDAVAWAVKNGITSGTTKTTFSPANNCTRGQIVTFLYRAYK